MVTNFIARYCALIMVGLGFATLALGAAYSAEIELQDDGDELEPLTEAAAKAAAELQSKLDPDSEAGLMLASILKGNQLGPTDGWFAVSRTETSYDWEWVKNQFDENDDQQVSANEFGTETIDFAILDRNGDGILSESDLEWAGTDAGREFQSLAGGLDADGNGKLNAEELAGMARVLAATRRPEITVEELRLFLAPPASPLSFESEDAPSRSTLILGLAQQEIGALSPGPSIGEVAPDFELATLDGESHSLSSHLGEKPVALIFGNFTCGPFRSQAGNLERVYRRFSDRVQFYVIYVREAHPADGWWMEMNDRMGINIKQPQDYDERKTVAGYCYDHLDFDVTMLIDTLDDEVGGAYSGMPSRLYLLDKQQRVVFKSGRGPFGFKPAELETAIALHLNADAKSEPSEREPTVDD